VFLQLLRNSKNAGVSPIPELTLIKEHSTQEGPFYDAHCVPKHRQTRPRCRFNDAKLQELSKLSN